MAWRTVRSLALAGVVATSLTGCAAVGLTMLGVGAGTASGTGVGHALDSITYKTFTVPLEGLDAATLMALKRMDIALVDSRDVDDGRVMTATAGDRKIEIQLDRLTPRTTRMRVVAKINWFLRDRATATEIILQTDRMLTDNPHLATLDPRTPNPPGAAPTSSAARASRKQ